MCNDGGRTGRQTTELELLQYLEVCYMTDAPLNPSVVRELLGRAAPGGCMWSLRSEDGLPLLHLAVMNEATAPEQLGIVVSELLDHGAPPDAVDDDGDTALEAVLQLAAEAEGDEAGASENAKQANLASVRALLRCSALNVGKAQTLAVCSWLRQHVEEHERHEVLCDLEDRVGKEQVAQAWSSEELLAYLENQGYKEKRGVEARRVREFLDCGAAPSHTQNGATALLLVVLNPYSRYAELVEVFDMMIRAEPSVVAARDGFKLTPLKWAADYVNLAQQHGLRHPNPAALLALLPGLLALVPAEVDAGETCLKVARDGRCLSSPPQSAPSTRFLEGHRVLCRVEAPGGTHEWEEGVVIGLWYREGCWPAEHPGAPYEVRLDIGVHVFALADNDRIIRAEGAGPPGKAPVGQKLGGSRFQKRQRPDGKWEVVDTVSGKARPSSPPDSDDED
mmetsp:Transcript_74743/g.173107  ORF Transcript_74743/g.173107 Transcript_74743/m.173107 type:complete len:450 (+) Transcript_74743:96-1445(+)